MSATSPAIGKGILAEGGKTAGAVRRQLHQEPQTAPVTRASHCPPEPHGSTPAAGGRHGVACSACV